MLLIRTPIAFFSRECILHSRSRSRDERLLIWVSSFTCRRSRFSQSSTVFSSSPQIYFDYSSTLPPGLSFLCLIFECPLYRKNPYSPSSLLLALDLPGWLLVLSSSLILDYFRQLFFLGSKGTKQSDCSLALGGEHSGSCRDCFMRPFLADWFSFWEEIRERCRDILDLDCTDCNFSQLSYSLLFALDFTLCFGSLQDCFLDVLPQSFPKIQLVLIPSRMPTCLFRLSTSQLYCSSCSAFWLALGNFLRKHWKVIGMIQETSTRTWSIIRLVMGDSWQLEWAGGRVGQLPSDNTLELFSIQHYITIFNNCMGILGSPVENPPHCQPQPYAHHSSIAVTFSPFCLPLPQNYYRKDSHANGHLQEMAVTSERTVNQYITVEGHKSQQIYIRNYVLPKLIALATFVSPNMHRMAPFAIRSTGRTFSMLLQMEGNGGRPC